MIKSPLNYIGGKYKLLPHILPLFPKNINNFVDLFTGGCNVGVNVNANKIICNDKQTEVIDFLNACKVYSSEEMVVSIDNIINKYQLSKINKEGYLRLREDYNKGHNTWDMFYALVAHSFSNQIRFNSRGEFNMPFGFRSFNTALRDKFIKFVDHIKTLNIDFESKDFTKLNLDLGTDDFVYADPPYLIGCASYNENGGWTKKEEINLYKYLDNLNRQGVKFALSNVITHKNMINEILKGWASKYNIHNIDYNYSNCNYQVKHKSGTQEVLITNY